MRYLIWGAGTWGRSLYRCLKVHDCEVVAFIDNDPKKIGKTFEDMPIISFEEYKKNYFNYIIIIATRSLESVNSIKEKLHENGIFAYFNMFNCPWDIFRQYDGRKIPFEEALSKINLPLNGQKIAISGITFFGVLLYDYLKKNKQNVVFIKEKVFDFMKNFTNEYDMVSEKDAQSFCDVILQVDPYIGTNKKYSAFNEGKISFFEFPQLEYYQNPELNKFKNIYDENKRCFIVATGPSLKVNDLNILHENKEISFSMNRVYKVFPQVSWRPTYYFAADIEMFLLYEDDILNLELPYKFLSDWCYPFWEKNYGKKGLYRYHMIANYGREKEDNFSEDITKGIYASATVAYHALQMAVYMGFKKIYIIGADCEYHGDGSNEKNHFVAGYSNSKKATKPYRFDIEQMFKSYEAAKCYAEKHGINIYNATRGGKLEVFERVNFDSLF